MFLDLSKALDCLRHDLFIVELEAYGLSHYALTFIYNYLHARQQRVNIKGSFSSWKKLWVSHRALSLDRCSSISLEMTSFFKLQKLASGTTRMTPHYLPLTGI